MKALFNKTKTRVVFMVVLAMLLQIIGPIASIVYAEVMDKSFKIVREEIEDGIAYLDWEFTLDPDNPVDVYKYTGDFTIDEEIAGELTAEDGTEIGQYTISEDGEITIEIDPSLYDVFEEVDQEESETGEENAEVEEENVEGEEDDESIGEQEPENPEDIENPVEGEEDDNQEPGDDDEETPEDPEEPEEPEETEETEDPVEDEEDGETIGAIGKALGFVASTSEGLEVWFLDDEEVELIYYSGTIVVEGVREKSLFKLLNTTGKDLGGIFTLNFLKLEIGPKFKLQIYLNILICLIRI